MKVLSIGSDRNLFNENSSVRQRVIEYGSLVDELHIVVFSKKILGLSEKKIADNVWLHPTNSVSKLLYIANAIKIGKKISNIDLVTAQDPFETGIAGWRLARAAGARLQLQIHTDFLSPYFINESFLNKTRIKIAKFLLPKADSIRVVSKRIVNSLETAGLRLKTEPQVLPIFVDVESIRTKIASVNIHSLYKQFDTIILMVSRLEMEKNIPLALSVFKKVVAKHPKTGLVIVGKGSELNSLKKQISNLGLTGNVVFEDSDCDVISFYKTADIFLHTSNYEGYGMVLVEAASSDCSIVTTDVGVASEYFEGTKSAHICAVGDEDCLTDRLIKTIRDKQFKNIFTLKAQGALDKCVKEKNKKEYLARYKELWEKCMK